MNQRIVLLALLLAAAACEGALDARGGEDDDEAGGDTDTDSDTDADGGADADGDPDAIVSLSGVVLSATGFPIPGALVYVTAGDGPEIPDHAYCYDCEDVTGRPYTLSEADGSWQIDEVPSGTRNIVTRKGFFQRQRQITVAESPDVQQVPAELTSLPGEASDDGLDQIPRYAVLLNIYDHPEDLLAKMGLAELSGGHLADGTQRFDIYADDDFAPALGFDYTSVGPAAELLADQDLLGSYHMVFLPCSCSSLDAEDHTDALRGYVSDGGKLYVSCYASQWAERPYANIIDFRGDDADSPVGEVGLYDTFGRIEDLQMRQWLAAVAPDQDPDHYPLTGAYISIDGLSETSYNGHGVLDDGSIGGPVVPTTWVTDLDEAPGAPMTVTFPYDCGKVFYSTYHVVESIPSDEIRAQEWLLIYLFYEVGVCKGEHEIE